MPHYRTNLFECNRLDSYLDQPARDFIKGEYNIIDKLYLAGLLPLYYTVRKSKDCSSNDYQPVELDDALMLSSRAEKSFLK